MKKGKKGKKGKGRKAPRKINKEKTLSVEMVNPMVNPARTSALSTNSNVNPTSLNVNPMRRDPANVPTVTLRNRHQSTTSTSSAFSTSSNVADLTDNYPKNNNNKSTVPPKKSNKKMCLIIGIICCVFIIIAAAVVVWYFFLRSLASPPALPTKKVYPTKQTTTFDYYDRCDSYEELINCDWIVPGEQSYDLNEPDHTQTDNPKGEPKTSLGPYAGLVPYLGEWYFHDQVYFEKSEDMLMVKVKRGDDPRGDRRHVIMINVNTTEYFQYDEVRVTNDNPAKPDDLFMTHCTSSAPDLSPTDDIVHASINVSHRMLANGHITNHEHRRRLTEHHFWHHVRFHLMPGVKKIHWVEDDGTHAEATTDGDTTDNYRHKDSSPPFLRRLSKMKNTFHPRMLMEEGTDDDEKEIFTDSDGYEIDDPASEGNETMAPNTTYITFEPAVAKVGHGVLGMEDLDDDEINLNVKGDEMFTGKDFQNIMNSEGVNGMNSTSASMRAYPDDDGSSGKRRRLASSKKYFAPKGLFANVFPKYTPAERIQWPSMKSCYAILPGWDMSFPPMPHRSRLEAVQEQSSADADGQNILNEEDIRKAQADSKQANNATDGDRRRRLNRMLYGENGENKHIGEDKGKKKDGRMPSMSKIMSELNFSKSSAETVLQMKQHIKDSPGKI